MIQTEATLPAIRRNGLELDVERIRADFPILQRQIRGKPLVYLDNAATSQKPLAVLDAMERYYRETNANVHRGVHTLSEEATAQYEAARGKVAAFIGACCPKEVIWTRNATEALNLVAYSWGRANIKRGDRILLTEMEHHSNLVPWQILAAESGAELDFVPMTDDGLLRLDHLDRLLTPRTKLFAFTAASNVLGTLNPVKEMTAAAHKAGALVLVDACQAVPHMPVDVQDLDIDFMAFSGHKMLGPTSIGVLWGRRELLNAMPPFMGGGDMIREVHLRESRWNELPWKFEAGTPAIAEAIGLGAAVDYLQEVGMDAVHAVERELTGYAYERMAPIEGLKILGPGPEKRGGLISFVLGGAHPHDIAAALDSMGIAIRAGHHCAQPLHECYGIPASARASFYLYNTKAEVDALIAGLQKIAEYFGV
ncbi:MAG: putative cysteine desulfurase [Chloroflexi bacterium ADurb.Bin325]|nr:MAG: putative cysteine desulfurase [Chloroflexi bacterium ADurb.Bin325]